MNQQPDQLSKLLLEADGLLLLLHRHRDETPLDAIKLLRRKLELILALTEGLDEIVPDEPVQADDSDEVGEYIEDTVENPTYTDSNIIEQKNDETAQDTDDSESVCESDTTNGCNDNDETPALKQESEPYCCDLQPVSGYEPVPESESESEPEPEPEPEPITYRHTYIIRESDDTTQQHAPRRSISSVFNLNDKFRFRRELFGNSDAQYVECLDTLSAMTSVDEAREYLFDDLHWDSENEDVKAFLELLTNYYK